MSLPNSIRDEDHLEELLSRPSDAAIDAVSQLEGDILLLGAGGKMGPSLGRMVCRASDEAGTQRRVICVSRFSNPSIPKLLADIGVETIAGDLLDDAFIESLPEVANVIFMTGAKFGTAQNAPRTWAMNVLLPARVCQRFRYSRILGFSTGNVYPLVPVDSGGCVETDELGPVGEYAQSAVGRERMLEYGSAEFGTLTTIVRLNYAVEMRYGVLVDLAQQVLHEQPVDITMGFANVIWQADANSMALAALADAASPPFIVNVAGPELLNVRDTCELFGKLFHKQPKLVGEPAATALLNNGSLAHARYGAPQVSLRQMIQWTADWLLRGGPTWKKPTHFEVRSGKF